MVAGPLAGAALAPYAAAVDAGDLDRALTIAMIDILRVPAAGVDRLRGTPIWSRMAELAPTWVRELRVIDGHGPDVTGYASVTTPTLFLQARGPRSTTSWPPRPCGPSCPTPGWSSSRGTSTSRTSPPRRRWPTRSRSSSPPSADPFGHRVFAPTAAIIPEVIAARSSAEQM
ncbi:hypothetical protein NJ76_01465 [Rhodococcus sp. IITR03]|nr:hypothetical protein NJ76_01465 [Rhodococcus sp. IITR03]